MPRKKNSAEVRQSLSDINNASQPLAIEIVEFENALTQAGKVDLATEHASHLAKNFQAISGNIDGGCWSVAERRSRGPNR